MKKTEQLSLPAAPFAKVPAQRIEDAIFLRAYVDHAIELIGEASKIRAEERAKEWEAAETAMAEEARAKYPNRRPRLDIVREYLESGGVDGAGWHGIGFPRQSIHGQEIIEHLERNDWRSGDLHGEYARMVAEGLVEPDVREGAPPPWCRTYGQNFSWALPGSPHTCWWDLTGSRYARPPETEESGLSPEEIEFYRAEIDRLTELGTDEAHAYIAKYRRMLGVDP